MRLPFLKKGKAKIEGEEILLALDVGTKFVKAVLFKVIDNKVNVIGYARTPQQSNSPAIPKITLSGKEISFPSTCSATANACPTQISVVAMTF